MSNTMLPQDFKERMNQLTPKERTYFQVMWAKSGVLYITAKPGVAKSAIARSIAKKMGFRYLDIRLSMSDESDFKYPYLEDCQSDGSVVKVSGYAVPRWAFESNKQPTLIHFEELNRAPQFVRNAALQILLEREIGEFRFNDNVIMMASGNLGDEDGTDVEEFDAALNNRLVHYHHSLNLNEWLEGFANENVHRMVISYLKAYPENLYKTSDNSPAYATPRSWTFLSDFIVRNYGKDSGPTEFLPQLKMVAASYVGNCALKFIQYCEDMLKINISDILNNYPQVKKDLDNYNRDKKSELIQALRELDVNTFNKKQMTNLAQFLKNVGDDERTSYLLFILDNNIDVSKDNIRSFMLEFKDDLKLVKNISKEK
jgi:hypothetical protein